MAECIRAFDWSETPLGAVKHWPSRLQLMVELVLASPAVSSLVCGPERLLIYNDAAARLYGERHPAALGRPLPETFPESWPDVTDLYRRVFAGEAVAVSAQPLDLRGNQGQPTEVFDAYLTPVRDDNGAVMAAHMVGFEIGARLAAEAALRESEARHRLLIGIWAQAIWETDAAGVVTADSPSWRAYTGQTVDEWLGYGWLNAIHPDDRAYAEQQWRKAIEVRRLVDAEFRLRAPGGAWRWTNARAAPVLDATGRIEKWAGMNIDIDARKQAEAGQRASEAQLAVAFESVPVGAAVIDLNGRAVFANEEYRHFLPTGLIPSRDPGRLARWRAWDKSGRLLEPSEFPGARALRGESVVPGQEMLFTDDEGREIWTRVATAPIRDGQGQVTGVVTTISDIDVAKRTGEALRDSEERLRQFGEASSDVLWIRAVETLRWTYLTPAFEKIYGLSRKEALTGNDLRRWVELIVPEDREMALDAIRRVRKGEKVQFEYRIRRPVDGELRWLRNTDFPIRDASGAIVAIGGIGHDVTAEKEAASRREVLFAELQHRTRNLVGVVRAIADRTAQGATDLDSFLPRFRDRLGALARINSLLSKLDKGERVTFDAMLRTELEARGFGEEGSARVVLDGPAGVRLRSASVQTFALAIHELATNAVKYGALSEGGGQLKVLWRLRRDEAGSDRLQVEWIESGVADMPKEEAPPQGGGYGRMLIEKALPYQLHARTTYDLGRDGVRCTIDVPLR